MNKLEKRIIKIITDSILVPHGILLYELERFTATDADAAPDALDRLIMKKAIVRIVAKHKHSTTRAYALPSTVIDRETESNKAVLDAMQKEMREAVRLQVMSIRIDKETDPAQHEYVYDANKPYTEYGISENDWLGLFEDLAEDYDLEHTEEPTWLATQYLTPAAVADWLIEEIKAAEADDDDDDDDED